MKIALNEAEVDAILQMTRIFIRQYNNGEYTPWAAELILTKRIIKFIKTLEIEEEKG